MRYFGMGAVCVSMISAPVMGATLIQGSSNRDAVQGGFRSFDPTLGTLTNVVLSVRSETAYRLFARGTPETNATVTYTIEDTLRLTLRDYLVPGAGRTPIELTLPLAGAGSFLVIGQRGDFEAKAYGIASFDLDPAYFTFGRDPRGIPDLGIRSSPINFYTGRGITFSADEGVTPGWGSSFCGGDEGCNYHRYTLTYQYDPAVVVVPPSVPEPTTWLLLILGFGGIGASMRNRRSVTWGPSRAVWG